MKFTSIVWTAASGSVGGATYAHNRYGMYLRSRAIPVNPRSESQTAVRNWFSGLMSSWVNTLTDGERDAWKQYANAVTVPDSLGNQQHLSASNWFIGSNVPRLQAGLDEVDDGPTNHTRATLTAPTISAVTTTSAFSIAFTSADAWAGAVGGGLVVAVSPPQNQTLNFYDGPYRYAGVVLGAASRPSSPKTIISPFGAPAAGTRIFATIRALEDDGRTSTPFPVQCDTT